MAKLAQVPRTSSTAAKSTKPQPASRARRLPSADAAKKKVQISPNAGVHPTGKIATLISLLRRAKGASIADLMKATGWQAHSVRGAISGSIKKKIGLNVASEKTDGVRLYRVVDRSAG